jgi:hypothetical protein
MHLRNLSFVTTVSLSILLPATSWGQNQCEDVTTSEFEAARMIIEYNATDLDVGVQFFVDAEQWRTLRVIDPNGLRVLRAGAKGALLAQGGGTELFLESVEPEISELPLSEFFARFPEGEYRFVGRAAECEKLLSRVPFKHGLPAGPVLVAPGTGGENCALGTAIPTVVQWQTVTKDINNEDIVVEQYEVVVEQRENEDHVFDVFLGPTATQVVVPAEFLMPGTDYDFEVLAIADGGNQTISEGCFTTAE